MDIIDGQEVVATTHYPWDSLDPEMEWSPVEGSECPICYSGTIVAEEGELRCAGECGVVLRRYR